MSEPFENGKVYTLTNSFGRSMPVVYIGILTPSTSTSYWYDKGARFVFKETTGGHGRQFAAASDIRERLPTDDAKEAQEAKERVEEHFRKKALKRRGPNDWWYD